MNGTDEPVVVLAEPRREVVRWAAEYAGLLGSPLRVLHTAPVVSGLLDELRGQHPGPAVDHRHVADALDDALVAESEHAHAIVLADSGEEVVDERSVATALSTRSRCPVVSVPPGATWRDRVGPVVVGAHHPERTPRKLEFALAEAARLGTGVRVVRCGRSRRPADDLDALLGALGERYPDVPVHAEVLDTSPSNALAWHAHFGSMVVVGSRRGGALRGALVRSLGREVLRRGPSPVVVIGERCRASIALPELRDARS